MQKTADCMCKVGVLAATVSAILALSFCALSLGFRGDAPLLVQVLVMGLGFLIVTTAVVACWCRWRRKYCG